MRVDRPAEGILVAYDAIPEAEKIVAWAERRNLWEPSKEKMIDGSVAITPKRKASGFSLSNHAKDDVEAAALDAILNQFIDDVLREYVRNYQYLIIKRDSGYDLLKYSVSDRYFEHVDDGPDMKRTLSVLVYLNDDYEGGDLVFQRQGISVRPKKGMVVMFPSNFQYPHEALPVTQGTKYAVVTWLS